MAEEDANYSREQANAKKLQKKRLDFVNGTLIDKMLRLFPAEQSGFCRQGPLRTHRLCILLAMLFTLFGLFPDITDWELGGKKKKVFMNQIPI